MNERFFHLCKAFGPYKTNCYIVQVPDGEIIIDPGLNSAQWVLESSANPKAILLTHGHYDHIFGVAELKQALPHIPLYCPTKDAFMLEEDCFHTGLTPYKLTSIDVLVPCEKDSSEFVINGIKARYIHTPGHTPGNSLIHLSGMGAHAQKKAIYSGDFLFKRSIGRYDFPYSSAHDMKESLMRFYALGLEECEMFPGHGESTLLSQEMPHIPIWIDSIDS